MKKKYVNTQISGDMDLLYYVAKVEWKLKENGNPSALLEDSGSHQDSPLNIIYDQLLNELVITFTTGFRLDFDLNEYDVTLIPLSHI